MLKILWVCRGRPFAKQDSAGDEQKQNAARYPEWVPKVLMSVGCAVITLLLFKRLRIVTF
jgi:hypothetical protein